jgi:hypothetical protein
MLPHDLVRIQLGQEGKLVLEISPWLVLLILLILVFLFWKPLRAGRFRHFDVVKLEIGLGDVGKVEFAPNTEDIQIAHRIWTELVTRKAALEIDPANDVIVEVYNSWYALFGRTRQLIGDIPAHLVRTEKSTQQLVSIATQTLNKGLRPHLTRWQARFRNWYAQQSEQLKVSTPQEVQKGFPQYEALVADMKRLNRQLIEYADQLQKIVRGV